MNEDEEFQEYEDTYTQWSLQEIEFLWEQYSNGKKIGEICQSLNRYPDDVITYMCIHSHLKPEDICGFGDDEHLALWKKQQEAFETNPLFNLRKEIRHQELLYRLEDMLRLLINKR